ncbi:hypothetical protein ACS0TY_030781 [Phlomoides rotata]
MHVPDRLVAGLLWYVGGLGQHELQLSSILVASWSPTTLFWSFSHLVGHLAGYTCGLFTESQAKVWHINEKKFYAVWKSFKKSHLFLLAKEFTLKVDNTNVKILNRLILTLQVLNHDGGTTVHGKIYSKNRDLGQNILLLMYLVNIRDFGHLKEQIPLMLTDGTSLEHSPQSIPLH